MELTVNGGRSIGTYTWDPVVELEYPRAFQTALVRALDRDRATKTFKYVYLGGAFTEQDQDKVLWFYTQGRRVRVCHLSHSDLSDHRATVIFSDQLSRGLPRRSFSSSDGRLRSWRRML